MYDIKSIETGEKAQNLINSQSFFQQTNNRNLTNITSTKLCNSISSTIPEDNIKILSMSLRRRRIFQRQACLISIMAAFAFGLTLGVFVPMIGMSAAFTSVDQLLINRNHHNKSALETAGSLIMESSEIRPRHPVSDFPTIYEIRSNSDQTPSPIQPQIDNEPNNNDADADDDDDGDGDKLFPVVSFVQEKDTDELPVEEVFRNAFHLEQDKGSDDTMIVKKLDANDGSIKEFRVQRTSDGMFRKGPEHRISKPSVVEQVLSASSLIEPDRNSGGSSFVHFVPIKVKNSLDLLHNHRQHDHQLDNFIKDDIYWGDIVEKAIPKGFNTNDADNWNSYVKSGTVVRLENGCGRMQNRLVIFSDGKRACARYRQNTDQIQGELFSFYLGQLLNLTNLAPSAASVIDLESTTWSQALNDIQNAQWKSTRPVVLTKWLPDLEPAGIPIPFQPLERHLNKFDVWNITLGMTRSTIHEQQHHTDHQLNNKNFNNQQQQPQLQPQQQQQQEHQKKGLLERLGASSSNSNSNNTNNNSRKHNNDQSLHKSADLDDISTDININNANNQIQLLKFNTTSSNIDKDRSINSTILNRLIELAQWSDLIVFDYLIANLDRVVNNLYNYQWNADIMAAPAHNLARQINSQLLVFLDNESGLLHGYRLLKKYEAYHGLLLDNLCVFRQPTIKSLQNLRDLGAGHRLQQLFESSASHQVRDVLPSLPDKSIKILIDRIDRVLGQVQKCRDLFADR